MKNGLFKVLTAASAALMCASPVIMSFAESSQKPAITPLRIVIPILIGLAIAGIVTAIMASQLKSVKRNKSANNYADPDSFELTESSDDFLYSEVSQTAKPKQNDDRR